MPQQNFNFTDDWQKFNVPAGVKFLTVTLQGGSSGSREGGYVYGKMRVDPKDDLWIMVGRQANLRSGSSNRQGGDKCFGGGGVGGDSTGTAMAGNGGGGASAIRTNTKEGKIVVVAGGAGGNSGDSTAGGRGGDKIGEGGATRPTTAEDPHASDVPGVTLGTESSTGGTQSQGGKGGTSILGTAFYGNSANNVRLARGGRGAGPAGSNISGGGGGGGGWYPGGGGAAGRIGVAPAGGGGGGSNYTGGLYTATALRGGGGNGHGHVLIEWIDPNDPNTPPVPPDNITIDGKPIADGLSTKAKNSVLLKGTPDDPNAKQGVRMYVRMSKNKTFANFKVFRGTYDETERRDKVTLDGLDQDTRYYLRIYTQDNRGEISRNYRSTNFWTNRQPNPPALTQPPENAQFTALVNVTFIWNHSDPDTNDGQTGFRLKWRQARTPIAAAGAWAVVEKPNVAAETWTFAAGRFKGNTLYEWTAKTRDEQGRWGTWALPKSFYVTSIVSPPALVEPIHDEAVVAAFDNDFRWKFRTPDGSVTQARADLQYRAIGSEFWSSPIQPEPGLWTMLTGDSVMPGGDWVWTVPADTFEPGFRYEWQVRTYGVGNPEPSDWSDSETFWTTQAPGSGADLDLAASGSPQKALGVGHNRVFVYDRGGKVLRGEITPLAMTRWNRVRDDISHAVIQVNSWDSDGRKFLGSLRTWQHELVIFRDDVRVFEGPITRISGDGAGLEIEAKDVMAYVYRRIMRQGYNDSYRVMNGQQLGQRSVVDRASRIISAALAYDDPNVLAYLTPLNNADDATQSRIVKDFTRTAWEEVDDLAATAGLDYTTVGRRIILWDTHRPVGRLPEMRDGDFSDSPIVTEYGMSAANFFGVTNNDGAYGYASMVGTNPGPTGFIEQLASAYGESESKGQQRELTREDFERLRRGLTAQAVRNVDDRWPPPLVVRIPDNSSLSPDLNIGINQLIPGVWVPLRASATVRVVAQWQKLDSVTVEEDDKGERISVVMSPAPQAGEDPDDVGDDEASAENPRIVMPPPDPEPDVHPPTVIQRYTGAYRPGVGVIAASGIAALLVARSTGSTRTGVGTVVAVGNVSSLANKTSGSTRTGVGAIASAGTISSLTKKSSGSARTGVGAIAVAGVKATPPPSLAVVNQFTSVPTTTDASSYASPSFIPTAGTLLVVFVAVSNSVAPTPTLTASANGLTFTLIGQAKKNNLADSLYAYVAANKLVPASPVAMTLTFATSDPATGCIISAAGVKGVTKVGLAAIKQSAKVEAVIGGVAPSTVFASNATSANRTLFGVMTTTVGGWDPPTGWVEQVDASYSTPPTGAGYSSRDSGFTGTTITLGSSAVGPCAAYALEIDVSGTAPPPPATGKLNLLAVRVFPSYSTKTYGDLAAVLTLLGDLGIKRISHKMTPAIAGNNAVIKFTQDAYNRFGIKSWLTYGEPLAQYSAADWNKMGDALSGPLAGMVEMVSGYNEPNNEGNSNWVNLSVAHNEELWRRCNPINGVDARIPKIGTPQLHVDGHDAAVVALANAGIAGSFNTITWHLYPRGTVGADIVADYTALYRAEWSATAQIICTEAGYLAAANYTGGATNNTEAQQRDLWLAHMDLYLNKGNGVSIFELLCDPDPTESNREAWLGIVETPSLNSGTWIKRPAFIGIKNKIAGF